MSTLSELEYRVGRYYRDVTHAMVTNTEIDEALQQALDEFTQVQPLTRETVVLLASAGREIPLDELDGLLDVVTVWWPYDLTTEIWPPNIVNGFRLYWDDNRPVLLFDDHTVTPPAAGQYIRLWYT